ncbi:MAG: hypothetical protein Q9217_004428, partial [Psora testacea]
TREEEKIYVELLNLNIILARCISLDEAAREVRREFWPPYMRAAKPLDVDANAPRIYRVTYTGVSEVYCAATCNFILWRRPLVGTQTRTPRRRVSHGLCNK